MSKDIKADDIDAGYIRDGYTIAHSVAYRTPTPSDGSLVQFVLLVKTVEGKIEYPSIIPEGDEPVIKFFVGIAKSSDLESQHYIVAHGVEIASDSLDTFFGKEDY